MLTTNQAQHTLQAPPRLVAETRLEFRRAALDRLEDAVRSQAPRMLVDLGHTADIDASGLGVLVLLQKRARERMIAVRLLHPPASVRQMLQLTKLDYLFELED
ncbi:MAG: STAS domain-containing protein [Gemmatimonadetes bacterium]|nr:STAS domain-containing protein [Gemmatimonadota bacterium]